MQRLTLVITLLFAIHWAQAQKATPFSVEANPISSPYPAIVHEMFRQATIYQIDAAALRTYVQSQPDVAVISLSLGKANAAEWQLWPDHNLMANTVRQVEGPNGRATLPARAAVAYRGHRVSAASEGVGLVIDTDFLYGTWQAGGSSWFIEPLYLHDATAPHDQFLVYRAADVIESADNKCGAVQTHKRAQEWQSDVSDEGMAKLLGQCYNVPIALASDFSMFQAFGSAAAVENFMLGVLNNVQTNYDNEFADEVNFVVVSTVVITCAGCDPWSGSLNAGVLLDSFRDWGNGGGFPGATFSVASLWTNRDFNGNTIGVAYLGGLCTPSKYNVVQNFSANAAALRVLWAHELGHNFGATHDTDGSNTIMAPSVNFSNSWSNNSITEIDNMLAFQGSSGGCFSPCAPPAPPIAAIFAPIINICAGSSINFFDVSANSPDSWQWSFPGGDPATSSDPHPTVTYDTPGEYPVVLTVSNFSGSDVAVLNANITVGSFGPRYLINDAFELNPGQWTIENPDNSTTWTFGQVGGTQGGDYAMYVDNYNYDAPGAKDALVSPVLDFTQESGLLLEIDYAYARYSSSLSDKLTISLSTNGGLTYPNILFEGEEFGGGNFATAPDQQSFFRPGELSDWCFGTDNFGPSCISIDLSAYSGQSNVRIKIENENDFGNAMYVDNIRLSADCVPLTPPTAEFSGDLLIGCAPLTVVYTDESTGIVTGRSWSLPGGNPQTSGDPIVVTTYAVPGIYDAELQVFNDIGGDVKIYEQYVEVLGPPANAFATDIVDQTVFFDNLTPDAVSFEWDFGDGNSSTEANPVHDYPVPGTYTVTLTATNECGTSTSEATVVIESALQADFTASPLTGCAPLTVDFTDETTGDPVSWSWTFAGGTPATSSLRHPTVTYEQPGTFDVQLIVTDAAGRQDTLLQVDLIEVGGPAVAGFTQAYQPGGGTATFTSTATAADSIGWTFGDGADTTGTNVQYTYTSDGTYTVTQIAYGTCGNDTLSQSLTIVLPTFSATDTLGCVPLTITYTADDPQPGYTYFWTFPGGVPANALDDTVTVTYNGGGTYDVMLVVTDDMGTNTVVNATDYVTALDVPEPTIGIDYIIGDTSALFYDTGLYADSLFWTFGDGQTASGDSVEHIYTADNTYTIQLYSYNDCGADSTMATLEVITFPEPQVSVSDSFGCAPFTTTFYAAPTTDNGSINYTWAFNGGDPQIGMGDTVTVTYTQPGTYNVVLMGSNAVGDTTLVLNDYVTVWDTPEADFQIDDYAVGQDSALFIYTGLYADSLFWTFGDGQTASGDSIRHTYAAPGVYTVALAAYGPCGADTTAQTLTIVLPPVPGVLADVTQGCVPLTVSYAATPQSPGTTYSWDLPGAMPPASFDSTVTVTYTMAGTYDVSLTLVNAAGDSSLTLTDYITVSDSPTADFTIDYTIGDTEALFYYTGVLADSLYWTFGDGQTASGDSIVHNFADFGTFSVTLVAFNACGMGTDSQELTIVTVPEAIISADMTTGCAPLTVTYAATPQAPGTAYAWDLPGGQPAFSTDSVVTVTYPMAGSYDVTLAVVNPAGSDNSTLTNAVTVGEPPTVTIATDYTAGDLSAGFTATGTAVDSVYWTFGDGQTGTGTSVQATYTNGGMYTVTATAFNDCGSATATTTIEIVLPPNAEIVADDTNGCAPLTVQYQVATMQAGDTYSWSFPGGTPSSSTAAAPMIIYAAAGTYNVSLTVTNAAGTDTEILSDAITVGEPPTVTMTTNYVPGNLSAVFTAMGTAIDSVYWTFGDGQTGTGTSVQTTYVAEGTYTVTATAFNDCGSVTTTTEVTVVLPPTADILADNVSGCAPLTVQLQNAVQQPGYTYTWLTPGGTPSSSTAAIPEVVYQTPGVYDVSLSVTNAAGTATDVEIAYITVGGPPVADFLATANNFTVQFTDLSTAAATYLWTFGDGQSSTDVAPTYTYATNGTFDVLLTVSNACGTHSLSQSVTVNGAAPVVEFTATNNNGCAPLTVQFTDMSLNADSLYWEFPGGDPATSSLNNPVVTYTTPGVYDATLIAYNGAGSSALNQIAIVAVGGAPQAGFSFTNDQLTYTFASADEPGVSYAWTFGDGGTSTAANPVYVYPGAGTYTVELTATSDCGESTVSQTFTIDGAAPGIAIGVDSTLGCVPMVVQFSADTFGEVDSLRWTFPGGMPATSTETHPMVLYDVPGVYDVELQASNAFGTTIFTETDLIVVQDVPELEAVTATNGMLDITFTATPDVSGWTYRWDFGDGSMDTTTVGTTVHSYSEEGVYTVVVYATNGCGEDVLETTLSVIISHTTDTAYRQRLRLFPNPTTGLAWLDARDWPMAGPLTLTWYDSRGRLLREQRFGVNQGDWQESLQLTDLPNGVYWLRLTWAGQTWHERLVKQ